ncbi:MAG: hypothetical protein GKC04_02560 [Methanomicrobiales archaeon]|nr:hypothetical protein [Methanomicrobiales archaeon]
MDHIRQIPIEIRWRIAARTLAFMPLAFSRAFRESARASFDEVRSSAYRGIAREAAGLLSMYHLPSTHAAEIAHAEDVISSVLFGPVIDGDAIEISHEKAVFRIVACPFSQLIGEPGITCTMVQEECRAFHTALVEELNPAFAVSFSAGMCAGEPFCDMTIARKYPVRPLGRVPAEGYGARIGEG